MRLLLINDTSTSRNQGCQATMHMVNRCLEQYFPDATIDRVFLPTINYQFTAWQKRRLLPGVDVGFEQARRRMLRSRLPIIREYVAAIEAAELIVINGEGSVLEDQPNARMIYMAAELANHFGTPCHLVNFTAHITRPRAIAMAEYAFSRCASVSVREPLSYYHVRRFHPSVKLFPDVVAGIDVVLREDPPPAPSVLLGGGSATLRMVHRRGQMQRLATAMTEIRDQLLDGGFHVRLLGWFRDEWLQRLATTGATYHTVDFARYAQFCREARVNFTGRHHGCVMSFAAGCPFLTTTANCFKNYGDQLLYGDFGPVYEMRAFDPAEVAERILRLAHNAEPHRERLRRRYDELKPWFFGAFENIVRPREDLVQAGLCNMETEEQLWAFSRNSAP